MDELLYERVKQLRELEDRLERIEKKSILYSVTTNLRGLRNELLVMIQEAERQHAEF